MVLSFSCPQGAQGDQPRAMPWGTGGPVPHGAPWGYSQPCLVQEQGQPHSHSPSSWGNVLSITAMLLGPATAAGMGLFLPCRHSQPLFGPCMCCLQTPLENCWQSSREFPHKVPATKTPKLQGYFQPSLLHVLGEHQRMLGSFVLAFCPSLTDSILS